MLLLVHTAYHFLLCSFIKNGCICMNKKNLIWGIILSAIILLLLYTIITGSQNFSYEILKNYIIDSDRRWLALSFLCMFGFICFEGHAVVRISQSLGYKSSDGHGALYGASDVFFSAITPSATGGQPACAFFMMKDGIPGSATTVILLINLIMYNLALVTLSVLAMIFNFRVFLCFSLISKIFIIIGIFSLLAMSLLFYFLLRKGDYIYRICDKILTFLARHKLLRNGDAKRNKLSSTMEKYQNCADTLIGRRQLILEVYLWNILQRLAQFGVSAALFMATGHSSAQSFLAGVTHCFVSVGSNSVPIPGSMGVADYIMVDGFNKLIGQTHGLSMEILCRGLSFYGCITTSFIIVLISFAHLTITAKRAKAHTNK